MWTALGCGFFRLVSSQPDRLRELGAGDDATQVDLDVKRLGRLASLVIEVVDDHFRLRSRLVLADDLDHFGPLSEVYE